MSSNNPVNLLMQEHEVILKIENCLTKLDNLWETDSAKYKKNIELILRFLKEYSDSFHHHKEEDVLFPALEEHPDFLLDGILSELLEHHENFREYAVTIDEALQEDNFKLTQSTLKKYLNDLLDHISVENDELFIMAENLFSENQLETIFFKFKDIDLELGEKFKIELEQIPSQVEADLQ